MLADQSKQECGCAPHSWYLERMRSTAVYDIAERSRLDFAPLLSRRTGCSIWLKREDTQPVFSFKLRGAYAMMASLDDATRALGVVAASAGNHAQGVALSANHLGCSATIVVPRTTPEIKQEAIRSLGASLILEGDGYDEACTFALRLAEETGRCFIPPYDDKEVIAGQGTLGLELLEQNPDLDAVFVPVGGGGLLAGVALAVKALRPETKVIGVEPEDSNSMTLSLKAGIRVEMPTTGLFADGVAVRMPGAETFRICRNLVDEMVNVSNDAICAAIKEIYEDRRAILEPAGALAYAGLQKWANCKSGLNLAAICSGANVNFDRLRHVSESASLGEDREAIFAIVIPERPGSFSALCRDIDNHSITEFNYRMADESEAVVFAGVETRDKDDRRELLSFLQATRHVVDLTENEVAKAHLRHMVGGRSAEVAHERLFHVQFPERIGALARFLEALAGRWNISLFHYRNHGSDIGRVLIGLQVNGEEAEFDQFLHQVGYEFVEVTNDPALNLFLRHP